MKKVNQKNAGGKGAATKYMRKRIQCPKCKCRIIDTSLSTVAEVRIMSESTEVKADFYIKCNNCNTELALKKLG
jgi:DNA-directed RNA polymerase subunit RPC12/RpoP